MVIIGFNQTEYSVQEGMDFTVTIGILYGTLEDSVVVNVISLDGTAVGKVHFSLSTYCVDHNFQCMYR